MMTCFCLNNAITIETKHLNYPLSATHKWSCCHLNRWSLSKLIYLLIHSSILNHFSWIMIASRVHSEFSPFTTFYFWCIAKKEILSLYSGIMTFLKCFKFKKREMRHREIGLPFHVGTDSRCPWYRFNLYHHDLFLLLLLHLLYSSYTEAQIGHARIWDMATNDYKCGVAAWMRTRIWAFVTRGKLFPEENIETWTSNRCF